jgi:cysteinyl-tRNA synthetase
LTNAHQIRLSRIAAATSTSQELLNAAGQITEKLQSALILSPKFEDNLTGLHAFVAEKQTRINELFKEHQQLTEEMKQLQKEVMDINPMNYVKKHHMDVGDDDDVNDDEFMEDVVASVRGVGRKWVGRMEESERVRNSPLEGGVVLTDPHRNSSWTLTSRASLPPLPCCRCFCADGEQKCGRSRTSCMACMYTHCMDMTRIFRISAKKDTLSSFNE